MHTTRNTADSAWDKPRPKYESLPGQQQLFAERELGHDSAVHYRADSRCELFDTGKDLPGADETAQAIFWDLV
jgi:hypothetical protein